MKINKKKNYLVWIANFGVVPLFFAAAFLLTPHFFLLLFLLAFVTFVFETIFLLPYRCACIQYHSTLRRRFLSHRMHFVKVFFLFALCLNIAYASRIEGPKSDRTQSIILAKGEHKEIKIGPLKKFTVGNSEVISHKYFPSKKIILIKGKRLGFTELIIWSESKKLTLKIFIVSKNRQLKLLHMVKTFTNMDLSAKLTGEQILLTGEIKNLSN